MDLRFRDHASFHRAAVGMTASSAVLGVALHGVTPMAPLLGGVFGIAVGAALGYGKPVVRLGAAALASLPLLFMTTSWPALALCAGTLAVGLTIGARGPRGALTAMLGATVTLLAMWTALRFDHARATASWSPWVTVGASSAAMGIVGVIAMLPRHLSLEADPVRRAIALLPASLDSEVRGLCTRTVMIWNEIKVKLGESDPSACLVRDAVVKTLEVATTSTESQPNGATDEDLDRRMADLDRRILEATDLEVKTQYVSARAALADQRGYRDRIRQHRERLVARLHHHLAALEKFQLAVGVTNSQRSLDLGPQHQDLLRDVAAIGEALGEVGEA
jgi:hypothetical protein